MLDVLFIYFRLSRARRVSENAFGQLTTRFRVLDGTINQKPENACQTIMAGLILHNYLKDNPHHTSPTRIPDVPLGIPPEDDGFPQEVPPERRTLNPAAVRATLSDYFCNEGAVEFQDEKALDH